MSKYVKELISLDMEVTKDKKLLKKLFDDKQQYALFLSNNLEWILDKSSLDFLREEVHGLMLLLNKSVQSIVHSNQKETPNKFDALLRKFVSEQSLRHKDLNLEQYANMFEQYKPAIKQAVLKEKQ